MLTLYQKVNYLVSSILRSFEKPICPYCGGSEFKIKKVKYGVTKLLDCNSCHLYFRFPVEKSETNKKFYQNEYVENDGITVSFLSEAEIKELKSNGFASGNKNAERYISLFQKLLPNKKTDSVKIIDYGCSWGYITYQFNAIGYDVQGYEISKSRAEFGKKQLNIDIETREGDLRKGNNIFFSSHVIEHHPDIKSMINLGMSLLDPDGYFIAVSPNGCNEREQIDKNYHDYWGKVHPNFLNVEFYKTIFKDYDYFIGSMPLKDLEFKEFSVGKQVIGDLTGEELFVIVKKGI